MNDQFTKELADAREDARQERNDAYARVCPADPQADRIRKLEYINGELVKACEAALNASKKMWGTLSTTSRTGQLHAQLEAAIEKARAA